MRKRRIVLFLAALFALCEYACFATTYRDGLKWIWAPPTQFVYDKLYSLSATYYWGEWEPLTDEADIELWGDDDVPVKDRAVATVVSYNPKTWRITQVGNGRIWVCWWAFNKSGKFLRPVVGNSQFASLTIVGNKSICVDSSQEDRRYQVEFDSGVSAGNGIGAAHLEWSVSPSGYCTIDGAGLITITSNLLDNVAVNISVVVALGDSTMVASKQVVISPSWPQCSDPQIETALMAADILTKKITLSCETENAKLIYTLDGSDPNQENGNEYINPFSTTSNVVVKARAFCEGYHRSNVIEKYVDPTDCDLVITDYDWGMNVRWGDFSQNGGNYDLVVQDGDLEEEFISLGHGLSVSFQMNNESVQNNRERLYVVRALDNNGKITDERRFRHVWDPILTSVRLLRLPANDQGAFIEFYSSDKRWEIDIFPDALGSCFNYKKIEEDETGKVGIYLSVVKNSSVATNAATLRISVPMVGEQHTNDDCIAVAHARAPADISIIQEGYQYVAAPTVNIADDMVRTDYVPVTWTEIDGKDFIYGTNDSSVIYEVYRSESIDGEKKLLAKTEQTSLNDYSAIAGEVYYYWVRATCGDDSPSFYGYISGFVYPETPLGDAGNAFAFESDDWMTMDGASGSVAFRLTNAWEIVGHSAELTISPMSGVGAQSIGLSSSAKSLRKGYLNLRFYDHGRWVSYTLNVMSGGTVDDSLGPDTLPSGEFRRIPYPVDIYGSMVDKVTCVTSTINFIKAAYIQRDTTVVIAHGETYKRVRVYCSKTLAEAVESDLDLTTDADGGWSIVSDSKYSDLSVRSGESESGTALQTYVDHGFLSFWCKVSEELDGDESGQYLKLEIGSDVHMIDYSDASNWKQFTFKIEADRTLVRWSVYKHGQDARNLGTAWLDHMSFKPIRDVEMEISGNSVLKSGESGTYTCDIYTLSSSGDLTPCTAAATWSFAEGSSLVTWSTTSSNCTLTAKTVPVAQTVKLVATCTIDSVVHSCTNDITIVAAQGTSTIADGLSFTNATVTTGGGADWFVEGTETITPIGGETSEALVLNSGCVDCGTNSWLSMEVYSAGTISFSWRLKPDSRSTLLFYIDGVRMSFESQRANWAAYSFSVDEGTHTLKWIYTRNANGRVNTDVCGWVSDIVWTGTPPVVPQSLEISVTNQTTTGDWMYVGDSADLTARVVYSDGSAEAVKPVWHIIGDAAELISNSNALTAVRSGNVTVRCTCTVDEVALKAEREMAIYKRVVNAEIVGESLLYAGSTCDYACVLTYSDGSSERVSADWMLASGGANVAINSSGHVVACDQDGTSILSAWYQTPSGQCNVRKEVSITRQISVSSNVTGRSDTAVPVEWARKYGQFKARFGNDYSLAMAKLTGKRDGSGRALKVWDDYVMGTDPTKSNDVFHAVIDMKDGLPRISWEPNLNTTSVERTYVVWGRASLDASTPWEHPAYADKHNFFKVVVDLPDDESTGSDEPGVVAETIYIALPKAIDGISYDGEAKTGVAAGAGYVIEGNVATDAGIYTATATLAEGYAWSDGNESSSRSIKWMIGKASNPWIVEPSLTPLEFVAGSDVTLVVGQSKFGTPTSNYTEAQIEALSAGTYSLKINVVGTSNFVGINQTIKFTVLQPVQIISLPTAKSGLVYNGNTQYGVASGTGYTITGNSAINAGSYTATATLKSGYKWSDGSTSSSRTISWSIGKATNEWKTPPSLSSTEFEEGASVTISLGLPKFGTCQSNYTAADLATLTPGSYTLVVSVDDTDDFSGLTRTIEFAVTANASGSSDALYCVVDLSGGTDANEYPVSYLSDIPYGGWSDEYKTTKLVLRRIGPGTFTMGRDGHSDGNAASRSETKHQVTLTKDFWIGVFEITQKQWELVMGTRPSKFSNEDCYVSRPVEMVSYDMIRGSNDGAQWPVNQQVDAESFMGIIRRKTDINFDLPTDAQWEYACRAGTMTLFNYGADEDWVTKDVCLLRYARYLRNCGDLLTIQGYASMDSSHGTAKVGTYLPNAWGLYDMHGNVMEWTLDWYADYTADEVTDPVGPTTGKYRALRGGSFCDESATCCSSYRYSIASASSAYNSFGFRICFNGE